MSRPKRKKTERGIALITMLGVLAAISLLAASAVALSQYAEKDSYTFASFSRSAYIAEGAANRIYWLILNDRKKYPQRNIGSSGDALQDEGERYLADGVQRILNDYYGEKVKYQICDAVGGMDVSGNLPQRDLMAQMNNIKENSESRQKLETLGNRLQDYADSDSIPKLNSLERDEYIQLGLEPLPRNRPFQYREEILLIPGMQEFCRLDGSGRLSSIRLTAPDGLQPLGGRSSLYSTPLSQIAQRCRLTDLEISELEQAFIKWNKSKIPLKESLPAGFLSRLEMYFGTAESGFYTILIDTATEQQPGMRLAVTFRPQFGKNAQLEFYEYMLY